MQEFGDHALFIFVSACVFENIESADARLFKSFHSQPAVFNVQNSPIAMKLVIATTGASGSIYLQRLLDALRPEEHEIHLVYSAPSREVIATELGTLRVPAGVHEHEDRDMKVPFVSGSARFDAMVIVPCSMGTLGRIAAGTSDSVILRTADVFLKERRKLILVPRETPWNLIHARNAVTLLEAARQPQLL
jgi:flavin prenyltransferase